MDPRIVHVASELDVSLERTAENEGNLEFILDVIAAVDYANEMVSGEAPAAPITFDSPPYSGDLSDSGEAPAAPGEVTP